MSELFWPGNHTYLLLCHNVISLGMKTAEVWLATWLSQLSSLIDKGSWWRRPILHRQALEAYKFLAMLCHDRQLLNVSESRNKLSNLWSMPIFGQERKNGITLEHKPTAHQWPFQVLSIGQLADIGLVRSCGQCSALNLVSATIFHISQNTLLRIPQEMPKWVDHHKSKRCLIPTNWPVNSVHLLSLITTHTDKCHISILFLGVFFHAVLLGVASNLLPPSHAMTP